MKNSEKYGNRKNDVISKMFETSYEHGSGFCKGNILKYITRYKNVNNMSMFRRLWYKLNGKGTIADLKKAEDFKDRWINASHFQKNRNEILRWYKFISE